MTTTTTKKKDHLANNIDRSLAVVSDESAAAAALAAPPASVIFDDDDDDDEEEDITTTTSPSSDDLQMQVQIRKHRRQYQGQGPQYGQQQYNNDDLLMKQGVIDESPQQPTPAVVVSPPSLKKKKKKRPPSCSTIADKVLQEVGIMSSPPSTTTRAHARDNNGGDVPSDDTGSNLLLDDDLIDLGEGEEDLLASAAAPSFEQEEDELMLLGVGDFGCRVSTPKKLQQPSSSALASAPASAGAGAAVIITPTKKPKLFKLARNVSASTSSSSYNKAPSATTAKKRKKKKGQKKNKNKKKDAAATTTATTSNGSSTGMINTGTFTPAEHEILLKGLELHRINPAANKYSWKDIAQMIGTRTPKQVHGYATRYLKRINKNKKQRQQQEQGGVGAAGTTTGAAAAAPGTQADNRRRMTQIRELTKGVLASAEEFQHSSTFECVAKGQFQLAAATCQLELIRLYKDALNLVEALSSDHQQTAVVASKYLKILRVHIADMWCYYANILLEIGHAKSTGAVTEVAAESATIGHSMSSDDWSNQALIALCTALSCPLAGNHSSIAISLARVLVARTLWPEDQTSTGNTTKAVQLALKLCLDGIDRAHIRCGDDKKMKYAFDEHGSGLNEVLRIARYQDRILEVDANNKEPLAGMFSTVLMQPNLLSVFNVPYMFVDNECASVLCTEVNRLSRLEQKVDNYSGVPLSPPPTTKDHPNTSSSEWRDWSNHMQVMDCTEDQVELRKAYLRISMKEEEPEDDESEFVVDSESEVESEVDYEEEEPEGEETEEGTTVAYFDVEYVPRIPVASKRSHDDITFEGDDESAVVDEDTLPSRRSQRKAVKESSTSSPGSDHGVTDAHLHDREDEEGADGEEEEENEQEHQMGERGNNNDEDVLYDEVEYNDDHHRRPGGGVATVSSSMTNCVANPQEPTLPSAPTAEDLDDLLLREAGNNTGDATVSSSNAAPFAGPAGNHYSLRQRRRRQQQQQPQPRHPSWLENLTHTMLLGRTTHRHQQQQEQRQQQSSPAGV